MDTSYLQILGGLLSAAILCVLYVVQRSSSARRALPLPPGPNVAWYDPGPRAPQRLAELADIYGPVSSYRRGKEIVCVVNRIQAANDILQKHGADTVDRPRFIAAGEIQAGGMRTVLIGAGDRIRRLRRALLSQLQPNVVEQYQPLQMQHAKSYILSILDDPSRHVDHTITYANSVVMSMTYGKTEPTYSDDPVVQEMGIYLGMMMKYMQRGAHPVDDYPVLKYVPFATSKLRQWHVQESACFARLVGGVRQKMTDHTAHPSFTSYLLDHQQEFCLTDNELGYLTGAMYGAGSHTTSAAMSFVIMAAAKYPEEAAKVRAELDSVVGRDRLPTFEDAKLLPRVNAFVWETFRWRPVFWGGISHRAMNDIFWNGYVIPKGATIIGNHWGVGLDPDAYPDPHAFKPSRWLDERGNFREDLTYCNFGFGRRFCVGKYLATNSLFITTALLLWAFDLSEDAKAPIDTMAFSETASIRPLPYKAVFAPRIDNLQDLVEAHLG